VRSPPYALLAALALAPGVAAADGPGSGAEALYQAGVARLAVASFEEAAGDLEVFARRSPADARAPEALVQAARLRLALGEEDRAADDAGESWRAWGAARPALAAEVTLAVARDRVRAGAWEAARLALGSAMAAIDRRAPPEMRAEAHGLLARSLAGLARVKEAGAEHRRVLAIARRIEPVEREPWGEGARDAAGEARLFFADEVRLAAERLALPPYAGSGDKKVLLAYLEKVAAPWFERRFAAIEDAERAYARVDGLEIPAPPRPRAGGDPNAPWAPWPAEPLFPIRAVRGGEGYSARARIAAAERTGSMWADLLRAWRSLPQLPPRFEGLNAAYYQMLDEASDPIRRRSKRAFEACLRLSAQHRIVDEHTRRCEAWLVMNARFKYPEVAELGPGDGWTAPAIVPAPARR